MIVAVFFMTLENHDANHMLENYVFHDRLETENILIDKKTYKDLVICFSDYVSRKSIRMLNHELMGKIEEHEGKKI